MGKKFIKQRLYNNKAKSSNSNINQNKRISAFKSPRLQKKKLFNNFKNKLKKILPAVFKKDIERGDYLFKLFCDIIRINNLIDTSDDFGSVDFIITEQRILHALHNFFSIRRHTMTNENVNSTMRSLGSYLPLYEDQFEEICELGFGAYGRVYKARHILDQMTYAVKKIRIRTKNVKEIVQSLEEVRTLAKLNHVNIVTYNQAWIETTNVSDKEGQLDESESPQSSRTSRTSQCSSRMSYSSKTDYLRVIMEDLEFFKIITSKKNKTLRYVEECNEQSALGKDQEKRWVILYIQMNLCEQSLSQWMDIRSSWLIPRIQYVEDIATQILCGLNYIHNLNIVHHDINPKNIFISLRSDKYHVQIGDFGLACLSQNVAYSPRHSHIIGTRLYTAPEQLNKQCDCKSDVYSFGIVLFELLYPMETRMECMEEIRKIKKGIFPENLTNLHPEWVRMLKETVQEDPVQRPSAEKLLEIIRMDKDAQMIKLQNDIDRLKEENSMLHKQLKIKDDLISISQSNSNSDYKQWERYTQ